VSEFEYRLKQPLMPFSGVKVLMSSDNVCIQLQVIAAPKLHVLYKHYIVRPRHTICYLNLNIRLIESAAHMITHCRYGPTTWILRDEKKIANQTFGPGSSELGNVLMNYSMRLFTLSVLIIHPTRAELSLLQEPGVLFQVNDSPVLFIPRRCGDDRKWITFLILWRP
jgi:hypothetical protein